MSDFTSMPRGQRLHVGIFGRRNAGKSSLLNALAGQDAAVVSSVLGTTTDPVYKAMELLPAGPVVLIDTPGIDDDGELGGLRVEKTQAVLRKTDVAILAVDARYGMEHFERMLEALFINLGVKYIIVFTKADACARETSKDNSTLGYKVTYDTSSAQKRNELLVSAVTGENIHALKEKIAEIGAQFGGETRRLLGDLLRPGDGVVLVTPIDAAAPKGRLILPQQQAIRDVLDAGAFAVVTQPDGLKAVLERFTPRLVVTDSQAFQSVAAVTPLDVALTSFSILMARYKGVLEQALRGVKALDTLREGDRLLIAEGCTHHRQCDDIGTVKLPRMIERYTGVKLTYDFTSGGDFPADLSPYKLIIHCGGCMLNFREMAYRQNVIKNVPMTNYGVAMSHMQGILERCVGFLGINDEG